MSLGPPVPALAPRQPPHWLPVPNDLPFVEPLSVASFRTESFLSPLPYFVVHPSGAKCWLSWSQAADTATCGQRLGGGGPGCYHLAAVNARPQVGMRERCVSALPQSLVS